MATRYPEQVMIWRATGFDASGESAVAELPNKHMVRWEDGTLEVMGADATPIAVQAEMFTDDTTLPMGSLVWRGPVHKLSENPTPLYRVVSLESAYDLKGRHNNTSYLLSLYGKELPAAAVS